MKVLKFYADWCSPCQMLTRTINSTELSIDVESIDIDLHQDLANKYNVRGIPTLIIVDDAGIELKRTSGYLNEKQLKQFVGE